MACLAAQSVYCPEITKSELIQLAKFTLHIWWVAIGLLVLLISVCVGAVRGLVWPSFVYPLTLLATVSQTIAGLSIMQAFRSSWRLKAIVLAIALPTAWAVGAAGNLWAFSYRWPKGWPIEREAFLSAGLSQQSLAGLFGILVSIILILTWIKFSNWFEQRRIRKMLSK